MMNDGVILLHDNTHTALKTQELLPKFKWEVCSHIPTAQIRHQIWVPNSYLEQGSLQRPRFGNLVPNSYLEQSSLQTVIENSCRELAQFTPLEPPSYSTDSAPNLGSKHLSGTRFSSDSDVKTVAENWLNGQDVISVKPG
ncbi:hypothetical protein AVEN_101712-1 [Araneus ventricosus]|uniref:Uncharacterized protein n=1 Tax=Araneus ventricosus TaxID=182803 RepID=A0A4Y2LGF0_ARAVE|nr:hypothetical protein AVEN_101712-1 [Araneus ventricosus]